MVASNTTTIPARLATATYLVGRLDPPPDTTVWVQCMGRYDDPAGIRVFPETVEDRRRIFASSVFAGAAWEVEGPPGDGPMRWSRTHVDGHDITVYLSADARDRLDARQAVTS